MTKLIKNNMLLGITLLLMSNASADDVNHDLEQEPPSRSVASSMLATSFVQNTPYPVCVHVYLIEKSENSLSSRGRQGAVMSDRNCQGFYEENQAIEEVVKWVAEKVSSLKQAVQYMRTKGPLMSGVFLECKEDVEGQEICAAIEEKLCSGGIIACPNGATTQITSTGTAQY